MVAETVRRGDVCLINLNRTRGREIRKMRPCVVVSPDELNAHLRTFIVAPMTTGSHPSPFACRADSPARSATSSWISCARSTRHVSYGPLGGLAAGTVARVLAALQEIFAP